jgi:hypothetical protein
MSEWSVRIQAHENGPWITQKAYKEAHAMLIATGAYDSGLARRVEITDPGGVKMTDEQVRTAVKKGGS